MPIACVGEAFDRLAFDMTLWRHTEVQLHDVP